MKTIKRLFCWFGRQIVQEDPHERLHLGDGWTIRIGLVPFVQQTGIVWYVYGMQLKRGPIGISIAMQPRRPGVWPVSEN